MHNDKRTNRRQFLKKIAGFGGLAATGSVLNMTSANANGLETLEKIDLRGSLNVNANGLLPNANSDQGIVLQKILNKAASENKTVFLPAGDYFVSNITLPANTRLMGVPGASRLIYTGAGHFLMAEAGQHIEMNGIVIDGANRSLGEYTQGAVHLSNIDHAIVENCRVIGSSKAGIYMTRSSGRIANCSISGAAGDCAIFSIENKGLLITNNDISDCLNGGILVHRWSMGEDNTIVTANRIRKILAGNGGTGQWGNGINIFRAGNVIVSNNHISDCAFSAIRGNGANNLQIMGNSCLRSGETAIYSEFEFEGSLINSNIIDGGSRGISIANFLQGGRLSVVSSNLVRNIVATGPYVEKSQPFGEGISVEADCSVIGNVVEQCATFGIMAGWGPYLRDVIISNNVVRRVERGMYVSVVDGSGTTQITNNVISTAQAGGIFGYEWNNLMTGDLLKTGADKYAHLTVSGNTLS
ncbi:MAG: TIGR03808 family TAT-translocated repetitive protein [Nitratireductor sp.]